MGRIEEGIDGERYRNECGYEGSGWESDVKRCLIKIREKVR